MARNTNLDRRPVTWLRKAGALALVAGGIVAATVAGVALGHDSAGEAAPTPTVLLRDGGVTYSTVPGSDDMAGYTCFVVDGVVVDAVSGPQTMRGCSPDEVVKTEGVFLWIERPSGTDIMGLLPSDVARVSAGREQLPVAAGIVRGTLPPVETKIALQGANGTRQVTITRVPAGGAE